MIGKQWRRTSASTRVLVLAGAAALAILVSACSSSASGGSAGGGSFKPNRPVTFVVATGVGGGGDIFGRAAAAGISAEPGGPKIAVENHTGGNEVVGDSYALSHKNDPYYMFVGNSSLILIPFSIKPPPNYTYKNFTAVAELAADQQMLVVPSNSPYQSLTDLITAAKAKKLRVGLTSTTGTDTAVSRLVSKSQNVSFQEVILTAGADSVTAMLGGNVDFSFLNPSEAIGQLKANKLRALAVFSDSRYPAGSGLETVPTAKEQGIDVTFSQWRGLLAPGKLTPAQLKYWQDAATAWTKTAAYQTYIKNNDLLPVLKIGPDFTAVMSQQASEFASLFGGNGS